MKKTILNCARIFFFMIVMNAAGCATIDPPHYIQADNPYKRTYYGDFNDILDVVRLTLEENGWEVVKEVNPTLYERNPLYNSGDKDHILLFTNIKKTRRFIYSRSTHLNVYVNRIFDGVEVDIRYGSVRNFHLWKMRSYRNGPFVKKILDYIEQKLLLKK